MASGRLISSNVAGRGFIGSDLLMPEQDGAYVPQTVARWSSLALAWVRTCWPLWNHVALHVTRNTSGLLFVGPVDRHRCVAGKHEKLACRNCTLSLT